MNDRANVSTTTLTANFILTVLVSLTVLLVSSAAIRAADVPSLTRSALVIQKADQVITPQARQFLAERDGERIKVWVFFTDKGVHDRTAFSASAAQVELSEKARARRSKVNRDEVLFVDLPVRDSYVQQVISEGASHRRSSRYLNAASFEMSQPTLDRIVDLPFVAEIRPLAGYRTEPRDTEAVLDRVVPDVANEVDATAVTLSYGASLGQLTQINVLPVHEKGLSGAGVTLAIFDTGYRKTHDAFAQHYVDGRVLAEYDFVFDDGNTANEPVDWTSQWNHGTLIWGTSGGQLDGQIYGPAYNANFILCKTEDVRSETSVEEDNWVAALEWVDGLGADVITSSLAYADWYTYSDFDGQTAITTLAANTAAGLGMVVCNAMANSGSAPGTLHAPADAFDILACGAVNSSGTIADFSSRGPTYDGRTKPEVCAQGVATYASSASADNTYGYANGTSLSTPLVAGAATVLIEARPEFSPVLIRKALMETADRASSPDNNYGWGIIDLDAATYWGADFTTDVQYGEPPVTIQFTDRGDLEATSHSWDFGDGGSSIEVDPSYTFTDPGLYSISHTVQTADYGAITTTRSNHILVAADTLEFEADSALAGDQMVISVNLTNTQPIELIRLPFVVEDIQFDYVIDSVQLGVRTADFEGLTYFYWSTKDDEYDVELEADMGLGTPPLAPGSGEILKIHLTTDPESPGGLANSIDTGTVNGVTFAMQSPDISYTPITNAGTAATVYTLRGDWNSDGIRDLTDILSLASYLFLGGDPPLTFHQADVDDNGVLEMADVLYLAAAVYLGGPPIPTP